MADTLSELYSDDFYDFTMVELESGRTRTFYIGNRNRIS